VIDKLVEIARQSQHPKQKMGAVVADKRGRVLAQGVNAAKTHPKQARYAKKAGKPKHVWLHAELAALVKCKQSGAKSLYVLRLGKDDSIRLARPCEVCWQGIIEHGEIEDVYYSDNNGTLIKETVEEYTQENI